MPDPKPNPTDPQTDPSKATEQSPPDDAKPVEATPEQLLEQVRKKDGENVKLKKERKAEKAELERLRELEKEQMSEQEQAVDTAKEEARAEADAEWSAKLLGERIMRRATGKLADPSDVVLIDFSTIDDSEDMAQIDTAIDALLEAKPHLAATEGQQQTPDGTPLFSQGPIGKVTQQKLTEGQKAEAWIRGELGA